MKTEKTKRNVFVFSGLGADARIFQNLNFEPFKPVFIHWIAPLVNETIEAYATRIAEQIDDHEPTLLGVSFGGMLAIEVAKQRVNARVILLSTAKTKREIPPYFVSLRPTPYFAYQHDRVGLTKF